MTLSGHKGNRELQRIQFFVSAIMVMSITEYALASIYEEGRYNEQCDNCKGLRRKL